MDRCTKESFLIFWRILKPTHLISDKIANLINLLPPSDFYRWLLTTEQNFNTSIELQKFSFSNFEQSNNFKNATWGENVLKN